MTSPRTHLRLRIWRCSLLAAYVSLLGLGCSGWLEYEDNSTAVLLEGMGPVECTADWNDPSLPAAFLDHLNTQLTKSFAEIEYQIAGEIQEKGIGEVDSVRLTELVLRVGDVGEPRTSRNTLGFLSEVHIYVESSKSGTALPRLLLARHDAIPDTATAIILETTDVNLVPYHQEGVRLVTEVVPRTCLADDLQLRFSYRVVVRYLPE